MNILIVDDETNILRTTSIALQTMGHTAYTATGKKQAERELARRRIDTIILDLMLGDSDGLDLIDSLRAEGNQTPVIVFTAYSSIESAVESMKRGAYDYIQKPFIPEELRQMLHKLERDHSLSGKLQDLQNEVRSTIPSFHLESTEKDVRDMLRIAEKAARSDAGILLLGPSGTGKTMLARHIHEQSPRAEKRFVTVNCPSLSTELLESNLFGHVKGAFTGATQDTWGKVSAADGGTLFLDEIGELPQSIQPKLLRLLQDQEFERVGESNTHRADIRVVAATNRDLAAEVQAGNFREDLFYRLNVISLNLPPLRHRPGDILPIAESFVKFFAQQLGRGDVVLSKDARQTLVDYDWPGNLRELKNVIERALILGDDGQLERHDFPAELSPNGDSPKLAGSRVSLKALEASHIKRILAKTDSLEEAAEVLEIDPATLYRKRKRYGLS